MTSEEYLQLDGVAMASMIGRGDVSPRELCEHALARLDRLQPRLNAVVHRVDAEAALRAVPRGASPFFGVPSLLKDNLPAAGMPMTYGSALLRSFWPKTTHPMVASLQQTGLTLLGRTNMSELGLVPITEPAAHGPTRNPWSLEHTPGGSSGGSAAAVAAGVVPLAHAGDGGGSIRIPASACGLVGLKPSRGRHPVAPTDAPHGFISHHCVSRTVRDTSVLLDAVSGRRSQRWTLDAPDLPYAEHCRQDPKSLRIGLCARGYFDEALDPDVEQAVKRTGERLQALGHRVEEASPPLQSDAFASAFRVLWCTAAAVFLKIAQRQAPRWARVVTRHPGLFRALLALPIAGGRPPVEAFTRRLARFEASLSPSDLWIAQMTLEQTAADLATWFTSYDLWLTATLPQPPLRIGALDLRGSDDALERRLFQLVGFCPVANATGIPAISLPAGRCRRGLPIGAQLFAPMAREDRLLSVAGQLERAHPWPQLAPLAEE